MNLKSYFTFFLLGFCGCAGLSSQFAPSLPNQTFPARTEAEKIELFRSQTPAKAFQEIGSVNACCSDDTEVLINLLKNKAAASGGDAILGLDVQAVGGASATVIRYETPSPY